MEYKRIISSRKNYTKQKAYGAKYLQAFDFMVRQDWNSSWKHALLSSFWLSFF